MTTLKIATLSEAITLFVNAKISTKEAFSHKDITDWLRSASNSETIHINDIKTYLPGGAQNIAYEAVKNEFVNRVLPGLQFLGLQFTTTSVVGPSGNYTTYTAEQSFTELAGLLDSANATTATSAPAPAAPVAPVSPVTPEIETKILKYLENGPASIKMVQSRLKEHKGLTCETLNSYFSNSSKYKLDALGSYASKYFVDLKETN